MIDARVAELQAYVKFFWEEMRAIELVVEEVAAELGARTRCGPPFGSCLRARRLTSPTLTSCSERWTPPPSFRSRARRS